MAVVDDERRKKLRRGFKRRRKDALSLSQQADQRIEQLLIRRFDSLVSVRRFIFLWVSLFIVMILSGAMQFRSLSSYYQTLQPVPGGLYHEGVVGTFTNASPLFSTGSANTAVSRLVFSGLFRYDTSNKLVGDLATGWVLSENQRRYVVHLRPDVKWHDGKPLTVDDVVFTYRAIQHIEAQSPLYSSWKDIQVSRLDDENVVFELPNPLSSFPYALTNGIVPAHLLKDIPAFGLRSASFNSAPVGTGPFEWKFVEVIGQRSNDRQQRISLAAYDKYWAGRPKLDGFNLITFADEQRLLAAFKAKQINAISGLQTVPEELASEGNLHVYHTPLTSTVMAFFKNSHPTLSDPAVRKALVMAVDRKRLNGLFKQPTSLVNGPLLPGQLGYDPTIAQVGYDQNQAEHLLDQAGWRKDSSGQRKKDGKAMTLSLSGQESPENVKVAQLLQNQWSDLGVSVTVHYYNNEDLQSSIVANHDYDILLYGINIGVDPDVFAYWDSSQASISSQGHLNLSEYKSTAADQALESARTRADPATRITKYKAFLTTWVNDAPALALYQPNFLYLSQGPVFNYERKSANSGTDRFYNVHNWMIRQQKQRN